MKSTTRNQIGGSDAASDQPVTLAIRYLNPEYNRGQRQFATIFAGVAALLIWGILISILLFSHLI
jgi:hypothetical protein